MTVKRGFSLVELLVVLAIIGVLAALLLPAIQAARESARLATCRSNLKQIGLGVLTHEQNYGHFPYGGWGHEWVGIPNRGVGAKQPGGWIYNVLSFVEQGALRELGRDGSDAAITQLLETPVCLFNCPSRRACQAWPVSSEFAHVVSPKPGGAPRVAGRSDYAINAGATFVSSYGGPDDIEQGDSATRIWPTDPNPTDFLSFDFSGISHVHRGVDLREIVDGTSGTYLVGEKHLTPEHYLDGQTAGDNETLYTGYCADNHRFTRVDLNPLPDQQVQSASLLHWRFGSAHASGANFVYCDGSVRAVDYAVDPIVHFQQGHTSDLGTLVLD